MAAAAAASAEVGKTEVGLAEEEKAMGAVGVEAAAEAAAGED